METGGRAGSIAHISALDGARGLAVAGVLLFHGGHLKGGYLGVDFFFTLSGFLITSLLLAESRRTGSVGLGGFWSRRARRLLPALVVLMIGVAFYSATLAKPAELSQIRGDAFATLGYVANWHEVFSHTSYFALFSAPSPLNHTWSLAIEEQFYVIWPLLFVALLIRFRTAAPKAVLVTALGLAAVSSAVMIALYDPANSNRVYFGTDTRAAAILFGAALAAWLAVAGPARDRGSRIAVEALGLVGVAVLAIAWVRLDGQSSTLYEGGFLLCGLAATAVIAAAVHPEPGPIARVLSFRPLCALGLISYGVYLYHWPIDVALDEQRAGIRGWPLFALQTAVTLALAIASYRVVEQPIRHGALSSMQWRKLTPAIAIGLAIALFVTTSGASVSASAKSLTTQGETFERDAARAYASAPAGSTRIMIVGNSLALSLAPGFKAIDSAPAPTVLDAGLLGCYFPPQLADVTLNAPNGFFAQHPCDPSWEADVVDRFHPNIVFWIVTSPSVGRGETYRGQPVQPCSALFDALYQQSLEREVAMLGHNRARVVIVTSPYPGYRRDKNVDAITNCENQVRHRVAATTGAQLVDLFGYICPHGSCRTKQDGVTLRPDGVHFDGPGGDIVASWLFDQTR